MIITFGLSVGVGVSELFLPSVRVSEIPSHVQALPFSCRSMVLTTFLLFCIVMSPVIHKHVIILEQTGQLVIMG